MKVTITKALVLRALRTEPLAQGEWVEHVPAKPPYTFQRPSDDPRCKVCAVGAVLRNLGMSNHAIQHGCGRGVLLRNENAFAHPSPLELLSYEFEMFGKDQAVAYVRSEEFPDSFELDIPDHLLPTPNTIASEEVH